jgi:predicted AAA+ superfamily ATPase
MYVSRNIDLTANISHKSLFLLGPRQTGKTQLISHVLQEDVALYNLLDKELFFRLSNDLTLIRKQVEAHPPASGIVVIDEIQRLPELLDEVHLMIEKNGLRFLLTGSSARKLQEKGVNLLGGRARQLRLHPLSYSELGEELFDLRKALNRGLLPSIYLSDNPRADLGSYLGTYLENEVASEAAVRNLPAFSRFLTTAALCNGQIINYSAIANDAQVNRKVVAEYFQILWDTLIASPLPAWQKTKKRKPIETSKFFFFDTGIVRSILSLPPTKEKSKDFGDFFEAYLFHELRTYIDYHRPHAQLHYWRSVSNHEVDFILNNKVGIEVKAKTAVSRKDLSGLMACAEENLLEKYIMVSLEDRPRIVDGRFLILPYKMFLKSLWNHEYVDADEEI